MPRISGFGEKCIDMDRNGRKMKKGTNCLANELVSEVVLLHRCVFTFFGGAVRMNGHPMTSHHVNVTAHWQMHRVAHLCLQLVATVASVFAQDI